MLQLNQILKKLTEGNARKLSVLPYCDTFDIIMVRSERC